MFCRIRLSSQLNLQSLLQQQFAMTIFVRSIYLNLPTVLCLTTNLRLARSECFVVCFAGEQDAAAKASGAADEPPKPPFFVPRGTVVVRYTVKPVLV